MSTIRPRRSVLYMPGSNARALEKARTLPCDAVILDLEDAVAPEAKETARRQVVEAVRAGGFGGREVVIRVNGLATPWGGDDLEAAAAAGPDAILLPKVESAADVLAAGRRIEAAGTALWAMIETPRAVLHAEAVAAAKSRSGGERLAAFVLGTNDLAKETRIRLVPGRAPMLTALTTVVLAARAHGLDVLDGVFTDLKDAEGLRAECAQGRDLGMDGKTLIHPDQIAVANETFAPAPAEVEAARRILAAFAAPEAAGKGALTVDGRMVERLHAEMAARVVATAEAIAARG
jgi:citrate lyase subunit beta/citryl-CoA lyase